MKVDSLLAAGRCIFLTKVVAAVFACDTWMHQCPTSKFS